MAGEQVRRGHFAAGVVGLGLLRHWLDAEMTSVRLAELQMMLDILDDDELSPAVVPTRFDVVDGYTAWAEVYDDPGNPLIAVEEPVLLDLLPPAAPGGAVAVDAACGTGRVSRLLADRGYDVHGVDATEAMLDRARTSVPEGSFTVGSLEAMPLDACLADVTTCCLALNHVADFDAAVRELARVTKPGGRIVITDLHPMAVVTGGQSSFGGDPDRYRYVDTHARLLGEQLAAFGAAGLTVEQCREPLADPVLDMIGPEVLRPAIRAAFGGLPFAMVWSLRRPADSVADRPAPMALTPDELAATYAVAWTTRDAAVRRDLLASCCEPDVRFLQEGWDHEVVGTDALTIAIGEFQAGWLDGVDVRVEITTAIDAHHGYGRGGFVWVFDDDRGYGTDFVEQGPSGRLQTIVVFGDPGPPPQAPT